MLDGALALAVPTRYGQSMECTPSGSEYTSWVALDHQDNEWLNVKLRFAGEKFLVEEENARNEAQVEKLQEIFTAAHNLNPGLFEKTGAYEVITKLDFPQNWGLGSSSTLIANLSEWFNIDPYRLLAETFGGSGYDIAAAQAERAITYQLQESGRSILNIGFDPTFKDKLFFVYLNRKQNSRSSIDHYRQQPRDYLKESIDKISALTASIISCKDLAEFELLLDIHETVISGVINQPKIKTSLFPDFPGSLKSLGGWGGDFALATGGDKEKEYFIKKGYHTILDYREMVL